MNNMSWLEKEEEDEDKDEEEEKSLLTSKDPLRLISKLFFARFPVLKKSGFRPTNQPMDRQTLPFFESRF